MRATFKSAASMLGACGVFLLSACGGGGGGTPSPSTGTPNSPSGGQVQFSAASQSVSESAGTVTITVSRTGGSAGAVNVSVAVVSGTATRGVDYSLPSTTAMNFADGDSASKSVTFTIINDSDDEADESFTLVLNQSGSAASGTTTQTTITIVDDDDPAPPQTSRPPAVIPGLALSYYIKQLRFGFIAGRDGVTDPTTLRLFTQDNAASDFVQVGADMPAAQTQLDLQIPVHLYNWRSNGADGGPLYRPDACNAGGCTSSSLPFSRVIPIASTLATGYMKASDTSSGAAFGAAVAVTSDLLNGNLTAAIGAPSDNNGIGAVYVYQAPAQPARIVLFPRPVKITPPSTQAMNFGASVALSRDGNILAIGAPADSHQQSGVGTYPATPNGNAAGSGAVFIYTRTNGVWSTTPIYVKASDVDAGDAFGTAIALTSAGDVLAVGAPGQDAPDGLGDGSSNAAADSGAVYFAARRPTGWGLLSGTLKATTIASGDRFGSAVAMNGSGKIVAVGAPNEDSGGLADAGAAYLFQPFNLRTSTELLLLANSTIRFDANNKGAGDLFGTSVALDLNRFVLAVGAPSEDGTSADSPNDLGDNTGAVYVFSANNDSDVPTTEVDIAYIKAQVPQFGARFGASVALGNNGNVLAVGASDDSVNAIGVDGDRNGVATAAGAVEVLVRAANTNWSTQQPSGTRRYVKARVADPVDRFGSAVSLSADGNTLLVGAPGEDGNNVGLNNNAAGTTDPTDNSVPDSGAAFLY